MDRGSAAADHLPSAHHSDCALDAEWIGRTVVISASGVLDMLTAPRLEAAIAASLQQDPTAIVVDLTGVDFLASAGMGALVAARDLAGEKVSFGVVADAPATSRPLRLVGLAEVLGLHPTLDSALGRPRG